MKWALINRFVCIGACIDALILKRLHILGELGGILWCLLGMMVLGVVWGVVKGG